MDAAAQENYNKAVAAIFTTLHDRLNTPEGKDGFLNYRSESGESLNSRLLMIRPAGEIGQQQMVAMLKIMYMDFFPNLAKPIAPENQERFNRAAAIIMGDLSTPRARVNAFTFIFEGMNAFDLAVKLAPSKEFPDEKITRSIRAQLIDKTFTLPKAGDEAAQTIFNLGVQCLAEAAQRTPSLTTLKHNGMDVAQLAAHVKAVPKFPENEVQKLQALLKEVLKPRPPTLNAQQQQCVDLFNKLVAEEDVKPGDKKDDKKKEPHLDGKGSLVKWRHGNFSMLDFIDEMKAANPADEAGMKLLKADLKAKFIAIAVPHLGSGYVSPDDQDRYNQGVAVVAQHFIRTGQGGFFEHASPDGKQKSTLFDLVDKLAPSASVDQAVIDALRGSLIDRAFALPTTELAQHQYNAWMERAAESFARDGSLVSFTHNGNNMGFYLGQMKPNKVFTQERLNNIRAQIVNCPPPSFATDEQIACYQTMLKGTLEDAKKAGALGTARAADGSTLLHRVTALERSEIISSDDINAWQRDIMKAGVRIDARNAAGQTPIDIAIQKRDDKTLAELLRLQGAALEGPDARDKLKAMVNAKPYLHEAAENNHPAKFHDLVTYGADIAKRNDKKQTPAHVAAEHGYHEIVSNALSAASAQYAGDEAKLKEYLDAQDKDGMTVLHQLVDHNTPQARELVKDYVAKGASKKLTHRDIMEGGKVVRPGTSAVMAAALAYDAAALQYSNAGDDPVAQQARHGARLSAALMLVALGEPDPLAHIAAPASKAQVADGGTEPVRTPPAEEQEQGQGQMQV